MKWVCRLNVNTARQTNSTKFEYFKSNITFQSRQSETWSLHSPPEVYEWLLNFSRAAACLMDWCDIVGNICSAIILPQYGDCVS